MRFFVPNTHATRGRLRNSWQITVSPEISHNPRNYPAVVSPPGGKSENWAALCRTNSFPPAPAAASVPPGGRAPNSPRPPRHEIHTSTRHLRCAPNHSAPRRLTRPAAAWRHHYANSRAPIRSLPIGRPVNIIPVNDRLFCRLKVTK